ncbi:hypothetical protein J7T55_009331 [Diaporthe amygdali]|uniref:uncharacterized protein n=1 Tax=Phomopsis amygdali TaxID=1214568 RepID=UPI0022FE8BAC|nr:uncharacterized protein J7T55_009331 [Diaporthe amygdali]KAJ0107367.1 hypothetical protein J7T55_009331 [Diaporthe amygdali]
MSSLQSIMNVDEDQHDASPSTDKKDKDPATPASGFRSQNPSSIPPGHVIRSSQQHSSTQLAEGSEVARSSQQYADEGSSSSSAIQQGKRPAIISDPRDTSSAATAPTTFRAEQSRRESNTSVDSMDQHGYGSAASSSSMGGASGGGLPPNHPRRPMGSPNPEVPIRLTPITGRVSRAKKGVPVHTCDMCNPPKTFTRAEHLSEQEGDKVSMSGEGSRRNSTASGTSATLEERMPGLRVGGGGLQPPHGFGSPASYGGAPTSSSTSDMPPTTPNMPPTPYAPGGSPAPGGHVPTMSPPGGDHYGPSSGPGGYSLYSSRLPISMSPSPEPSAFSTIEMAPRTVPMFIGTENQATTAGPLQTSLDQPPELIHTTDYSPWTSASESNYSTPPPAEVSRPRGYWQHHRSHSSLDWQSNASMLSPFSAQRELHGTSNLDAVTTSHYVTPPFPMSPHIAPAPYHTYGPLLDPSLMGGFTDDQTQQSLLDNSIASHPVAHHRPSSVRSPSHPPSSAQGADTLVTPAALPSRAAPMAHVSRQKEMVVGGNNMIGGVGIYAGDGSSPSWPSNSPGDILTGSALAGVGGCGMGGMSVVTPLPRSVRNSIASYLDVYWEKFHVLYPFIHRGTVEGAGEDALKCAMAAIATQYLDNKDDRIRGNQLHEYAWQEAKRNTQYTQWSLQVSQAILLCELFSRFRGRKASVRPSKLFENLYSRVLENTPTMFNTTSLGNSTMGISITNEERWHTWIEEEARRRLLTVCFIVDNHTSLYHQQPRARDDIDLSTIPLTGHSDTLWAAGSAIEWANILETSPAASMPRFVPHPNTLKPEEVARHSCLDKMAILHAEASRLPRRQYNRSSNEQDDHHSFTADDLRTPTTASYNQSFNGAHSEERIVHLFSMANVSPSPSIYLALHHTPLHDLLAVSGDSWVFSQKVLGASTFLENQKRLKAWAEGRLFSKSPSSQQQAPAGSLEGMSCAQATCHAARALLCFLKDGSVTTPQTGCISDYWGMYVCVLIIWAFGHRAARSSSSTSPQKAPLPKDEAISWLQAVAALQRPEDATRMKHRREASAGVVSLVKRRLDADCVGPRSQLYVDAVGVLKKLEEGVNWRWF